MTSQQEKHPLASINFGHRRKTKYNTLCPAYHLSPTAKYRRRAQNKSSISGEESERISSHGNRWQALWGKVDVSQNSKKVAIPVTNPHFLYFFSGQIEQASPCKQKGLCKKGEDKTWTRSPWTPSLDRVHGPLSWTGSMDPLSWTRSMDSFFLFS